MSRQDKTQGNQSIKKGSFIQSISFQNALVYGLIIVAFLIFAYIWYSGMASVVGLASSASSAEAELINEMSELKANSIHMTAEINRYMGTLGEGGTVTEAVSVEEAATAGKF